jgi:hypothetical protein
MSERDEKTPRKRDEKGFCKCPTCGSDMTENEAINAGLVRNPDETWEQFLGRTGQTA